jgi:hypothetical protein
MEFDRIILGQQGSNTPEGMTNGTDIINENYEHREVYKGRVKMTLNVTQDQDD